MTPFSCRSHYQGFTLIEILVALMIFSIIGVAINLSLKTVINGNKQLRLSIDYLNNLSLAESLLEHDIYHIVPYITLDNIQKEIPACKGGNNILAFVSKGESLFRISYFVKNHQLLRTIESLLPTPIQQSLVIAKGVDKIDLSFLGADKLEYKQWPPVNKPAIYLPTAIKVRIIFLNGDSWQQWYNLLYETN